MSDEDEATEFGQSSDETEEPDDITFTWARASLDDLANIESMDIESPIVGLATSDCQRLADRYYEQAKAFDEDTAERRIFTMLAGVCSMQARPNNSGEPFAAQIVWADGSRSALLEDFLGEPLKVIKKVIVGVQNPMLKARLCHVCWVLDRTQGKLAVEAVKSYLKVLDQLQHNALDRDDVEEGGEHKFLFLKVRDILQVAAHLAWKTGWSNPHGEQVKAAIKLWLQRSISGSRLVPMNWFGELALKYSAVEAGEIAGSLESRFADENIEGDVHVKAAVWQLVSACYRKANHTDASNQALRKASDCYVDAAEKAGSALIANHLLCSAIAELHGLPAQRERRRELNSRLVDVQANILEEMHSVGHSTDIKAIIEETEKSLQGLDLVDLLFRFALCERSPDPEELEKEARESASQSPLASMFGHSQHDAKGRVVHRAPGIGLGDDGALEALQPIIARNESVRREIVVNGVIEVGRRFISDRHYISREILYNVLRHSPIIAHNQIATYCDGFTKFFRGDLTGALYVLTPLLENSLRHFLELVGHLVTKFDDSTQTQQDHTISGLFENMRPELEKCFTAAIITDIDNLFLQKSGPKIRHALAHGQLPDGAPYGADAIYACWLIFRLCMLPLWRFKDRLKRQFEDHY